MPTFVHVAVNVPSLAGVFDYSLPEPLAGRIGVGHLVRVPFGKQTVQGVILRFIDKPSVEIVKDVIDAVDPQPALNPAQIELAQALAESTQAPLASILSLFLPPGLSQQADTLFQIREGIEPRASASEAGPADVNPKTQKYTIEDRILNLLQARGPLRGRQIDRHFKQVDWRRTAHALVRRGVLSSWSVLPPAGVRPKFVRTAQLAVPPETAKAALDEVGNTEATRLRRGKALRFLIEQPEAVDVSWVYAESGCNLADLQELAERELIVLRETEIWRDPLTKLKRLDSELGDLTLTADQESAWQRIEAGFESISRGNPVQPLLLQGVTGSGKTELYLRAVAEAIRRGRQAIILVPEIALTPQTVRRFLSRFPGQVGLIHSKLSDGERYDTWRRARAGLLKVVIGPRSALFAPLPSIGLIVADECHDASYYQSEPPFYHAVTAAQAYARLCGAVCILGSATPSVVQRYESEIGQSLRIGLPQRITADPITRSAVDLDLPPVRTVDMREELKAGQRGSFSRELIEALSQTLARGEQAILFLNRRGTATHVFCRTCGYVVRCPRCDTPLTLHVSAGETLQCHHCNYTRQKPRKCPECGSTSIAAYGLGSEKVETEVQALFPRARTLRWDAETTRQKDAHEIILSHFAAGRADVLVGTQMLAKGLDLPRVTLVGIVLADVGLYLPDPFAAERVFQTLTQVAGRAGRSSMGGRVVLQTFSSEHYALQAAASHDVDGFHERELDQRRRLGYPPFSRLVRIEFRGREPAKAEEEVQALAARISKWLASDHHPQTTIIGPAPCFFSRLNGEYRWQVVLRTPDPAAALRDSLPGGRPLAQVQGWRVEVDPITLL